MIRSKNSPSSQPLRRLTAVFLGSFGILLFFLTPNVNTGDAGELVTAAYFLGIAHPSGYPLYLSIVKAFTLLPFGNMGFKAALVSAVFSSLSLCLLYYMVLVLTESDVAAFTTAGLLLVSYSYLTQSVIAKFYTLNLFLILFLCVLWCRALLVKTEAARKPESARAFHFTFFLFGLISSNHNTGFLIAPSVVYAMWTLRKEISASAKSGGALRHFVILPAALFLSGFAVNAYLIVRGGDLVPVNVFHVRDMTDFFAFISRQTYGKIGTVSKAATLFSQPASFWYGLKNFASIIAVNFGPASVLLFLSGCYFMAKRTPRIFSFAAIGLAVYGPLFTKIALPVPSISPFDFYVYANQYYLPALALYALFLGPGFVQVAVWLGFRDDRRRGVFLGGAIAALVLLLLVMRSGDCNYRTNYVAYQAARDAYSVMPVDSAYLALYDNAKYPGRYVKLIGRYREDVCLLNGVVLQRDVGGLDGCGKIPFTEVSPASFAADSVRMRALMADGKLWGDAATDARFGLSNSLDALPLSLSYLYFPKRGPGAEGEYGGHDRQELVNRSLSVAARVVHPDVCAGLSADDLLTAYICDRYRHHMLQLMGYYMSLNGPGPDIGVSSDRHETGRQ